MARLARERIGHANSLLQLPTSRRIAEDSPPGRCWDRTYILVQSSWVGRQLGQRVGNLTGEVVC